MMKPRNSERVQFSHHPNRGKKTTETTEIYPGCLYRTNLFYFDRGGGWGGTGGKDDSSPLSIVEQNGGRN